MSMHAMAWAWEQDLTPTRKMVLVALANVHNGHTGECAPLIAGLCADTKLCDRTVRRALADLEEAGFISRDRERSNDVYRYVLHGAKVTEVESQPVTVTAPPAPDAASQPVTDTGQPVTVTGHAVSVTGQDREAGIAFDLDLEQDLELDLKQNQNLKPLPPSPPSADRHPATRTGRPATLVGGRNLPFDALTEVCNIDLRNKTQRGRLTRALKEIREYFWEEVRDVAFDLAPEEYEAALARAVKARANEYDARFSNVVMTPNALSTWWHQMARPSTGRRATTAADRARIVAGPNIFEEMRKHFQGGDSDDS